MLALEYTVDGVKEDAAELECRNWTVVDLNREGWRKLFEGGRGTPRAVVPLERGRESTPSQSCW